MVLAAVPIGGFFGAPARYLLDRLVSDRIGGDLPWGTMAVNLSGAVLLGLLSGLSLRHALPAPLDALLGTGFCGAYTTFSTLSYETIRLLEEGLVLEAMANAAGSLLAGLLLAAAGLAIGLMA